MPNEGDSVAGVPAKEWEDYDVTKEPTPPAAVAEGPSAFAATGVDGATWARALTLEEIATIQTASAGKKVSTVPLRHEDCHAIRKLAINQGTVALCLEIRPVDFCLCANFAVSSRLQG